MGQARLREFLAAKEMSLTEFARRIGRSPPLVWMLTNRPDHTPSLDTALRIETATGGAVKATSWVKPSSSHEASPYSRAKRKTQNRGRDRRARRGTPCDSGRKRATK
jgi:transcriptional regulator with XRE-family HTH domain